ncbi:MAG: FAD-binding oxidoreductase [Pseudomonadota bacterium]
MGLKRLYAADAYDPGKPVPSWWQASAPPARHGSPPLSESVSCDVAIVGAGFTGLNAALRLARDHGFSVRVLDQGQPGFGASGRNGGFCCIPATKIGWPTMVKRYGEGETRRFFRAQCDAIDHVDGILDAHRIAADVHSRGGELGLAHRPAEMAAFEDEQETLMSLFGVDAAIYPKAALKQLGAEGPGFHGAMIAPFGFALHPLKYLRGLVDVAGDAGAAIHGETPVTDVVLRDGGHVLKTPHGDVRARHVIFATNGYTAENVPSWMGGRVLPALSSVLVTRPLSKDERAAQGFTTDLMAYDTRNLLHYFRVMPDGRVLFGGRGGTSAEPSALAHYARVLRGDFERMFPAWAHVETTHQWSGFVALSANRVPYVGPVDGFQTAWAGLCFHGNGVATGSWSGAQLADLVAGVIAPEDLPAVMRGPMPKFAFPGLRRHYLKAAYLLYGLMDGNGSG